MVWGIPQGLWERVHVNRLLLALAAISSIYACVTHADPERRANTYDVQVIDEAGKPVPYATIWYIQKRSDEPYLVPDVMARLLKDYAQDADYVSNLNLHRNMLVTYADAAGHGSLAASGWASEERNSPTSFITIAAIKRGYQPGMVSDEAPYESHRTAVIRLIRGSASVPDPALLELDRLRSQSEQARLAKTPTDQKKQVLDDIQAQARKLATALEDQGKSDVAARFYYFLANIPSVDVYRDKDGRVTRGGFTNGFREDQPQRVSDLAKARELNVSVPEVVAQREHEQLLEKYAVPAQHPLPGERDAAAVYVAGFEKLEAVSPERLWPSSYLSLSYLYTELRKYDKACATVNKVHDMHPGFESPERWNHWLQILQHGQKDNGDPVTPCTIVGFAP